MEPSIINAPSKLSGDTMRDLPPVVDQQDESFREVAKGRSSWTEQLTLRGFITGGSGGTFNGRGCMAYMLYLGEHSICQAECPVHVWLVALVRQERDQHVKVAWVLRLSLIDIIIQPPIWIGVFRSMHK